MSLQLIPFWQIQRRQQGLLCEVRPFHREIANALTGLVLGTNPAPNLMILMPPRCAKTDLGVRAFVPWAQSWFPDAEFILASYGSELATDNSVYIRNTLGSDWYRSMVGTDWGASVKMVGDKAGGRQDHFYTTEGGSVKAVGVGGGITGFGAGKLRTDFGGCIVVDDPLKANEKDSPAARKTSIEWFHSTLESRRNRIEDPVTPILLIMQRLHPQDLAGHLLMTERHKWHVVQIPAHDDEGNTIWPGRISYDELMAMKEANPDLYWSQYMQSPSDAAFSIYKPSWWRFWNNKREVEKRITLKFITADTAFKAKDTNDWSVFQCWGAEGTSALYLMDQIRGRWEFPELCRQAKAFWHKHNAKQVANSTPATEFWIEDKASGISLVQTMRGQQIPVRGWEPNVDKTSADKVGRANQCAIPLSAGRIILPSPKLEGYGWVDGLKNEAESFTADDSHLFDDQVDTMNQAALIWMERGGGKGPLPVWLEAA
jgi:predicted phage terminase large subunit-like protein